MIFSSLASGLGHALEHGRICTGVQVCPSGIDSLSPKGKLGNSHLPAGPILGGALGRRSSDDVTLTFQAFRN